MTRKRAPAGPEDWLSRLGEVREAGDRRATAALLGVFLEENLDEDRRAEIAVTLRTLEDVRCGEPLRRAILDTGVPARIRSLALEIHSAIPLDAAPRAQTLQWARSPDVVIRAFGVRALDVPDGETLAAAAGDPAPLVRYAAVDAMASIVRTRELVEATRRALRDDDASIREAACRVALFDEPLDVTHELIRALEDDCCAVRVAACDALEDFPRVSVLLALGQSREQPYGKLRSGSDAISEAGVAAHLAFAGIVRRVQASIAEASLPARRRLERWAEPVRWLLAEAPPARIGSEPADGEEGDSEVAETEEPASEPVDLDEAARALFDDDTPASTQRRMLVARDWTRSGRAGLEILRVCAASPNWSLRQGAAFALGDLGAVEDLVALAADREPVVRRAAFEELRALEERGGVGAARATLEDATMRATAGDDAMALVAELAPPREAERVIVGELERDEDRDGLWLGAIHLVRHRGFKSAMPHLRRIVQGPITSSVLPHVAALGALRELGCPKSRLDLSHLEPLDHLEIQRELGEWDWHGTRYG